MSSSVNISNKDVPGKQSQMQRKNMAAEGEDGGGEMGRRKDGPIRIDTHVIIHNTDN